MYFFLISIDNLHLSNFHVEKGVYWNFWGEDHFCPYLVCGKLLKTTSLHQQRLEGGLNRI